MRCLVALSCVVLLLVSGCGFRATAGPGAKGQLPFGGVTRTYELHVPAGVAHPTGLVVNLHGSGGTGAGQEALTHYDAVADAHGFVVVYPDGVERSWADGRGASPADRRGVDDVGFLTTLVASLVREYGIDPGHVFAVGFSNGAFMVDRLACERPDVFAAIAPVSGTLGAGVGCTPSRPVSVIETHGTADPIVPFNGGPMTGRGGRSVIVSALAMSQRWRQINGCRDEPAASVLPGADGLDVRRSEVEQCAGGSGVVFMQVDGGGHTWPGGSQYLPKALIGPTTRAFDESETSWQFFAGHAR
ncbi:MAG TPA: PHB depolymerase family esterase [Mycobacterium sp.]|nr:PHB depolymerase family esterase [Mycobacterium sp.]